MKGNGRLAPKPVVTRNVSIGAPLSQREIELTKAAEAAIAKAVRVEREFEFYKRHRRPWSAGKELALVLPIAWGDIGTAVRLLDWLIELEEGKQDEAHPLVLCLPSDIDGDLREVIARRIDPLFKHVHAVDRPFDFPSEHWPVGPNWSFFVAAEFCHHRQWDFMILEPDAVPLRKGWLKAIEREYRGSGRPYMGHFEPPGPEHQMHLAGVAVYNWEAFQRFHVHEFHKAWDVAMGPTLVAEAHESKTIQQVWGENWKAPIFTRQADTEIIRPDAMVFHRNKDGSLIARLREQRYA